MHAACADADVAAQIGVVAEIAVNASVALSNVTKHSKRKSRQNEKSKLKYRNDEIDELNFNVTKETKNKGNKRVMNRQNGASTGLSNIKPIQRNDSLTGYKWLRLVQRIGSARYFRWFAAGIAVFILIGAIVLSRRER